MFSQLQSGQLGSTEKGLPATKAYGRRSRKGSQKKYGGGLGVNGELSIAAKRVVGKTTLKSLGSNSGGNNVLNDTRGNSLEIEEGVRGPLPLIEDG